MNTAYCGACSQNFGLGRSRNELTLVQEQDNFVEGLQEVHVVVAILLDLVEKVDLRLEVVGEGSEEGEVVFQVTQSLVLQQLLLLVPLNTGHHTLPNLQKSIHFKIIVSRFFVKGQGHQASPGQRRLAQRCRS